MTETRYQEILSLLKTDYERKGKPHEHPFASIRGGCFIPPRVSWWNFFRKSPPSLPIQIVQVVAIDLGEAREFVKIAQNKLAQIHRAMAAKLKRRFEAPE